MPTQRELEMARGAEVAARHEAEHKARLCSELGIADWAVKERRDVLTRWVEAKKLTYRRDKNGNKEAFVAGEMVVSERYGPAWPSESYVANVGLAIGALSSFEGVKETTAAAAQALQARKRRDQYRAQHSQWRTLYEPDKL